MGLLIAAEDGFYSLLWKMVYTHCSGRWVILIAAEGVCVCAVLFVGFLPNGEGARTG
jgi:hypothetical protein